MGNNIRVDQIKNKPIDSNCYVVYTGNNSNCIIIDPGTEDSEDLIGFLQKKELKPDYILLTHEHFDHIWGVKDLKTTFSFKVVCSIQCSQNIINNKRNLSIFYNQVGFVLDPAEILVDNINNTLNWNNNEIKFIETPGHTTSSISISISNFLFTGDAMIKGYHTVTKLPGGDALQAFNSIGMIKSFFHPETVICPGHGAQFELNEY